MFKNNITKNEIFVEGMHCVHCANRVSDSLKKIKGVKNVDVDIESGKVTFSSKSPIDENVIKSAIESAGYQLKQAN